MKKRAHSLRDNDEQSSSSSGQYGYTPVGIQVLFEESHTLPLVDVQLTLRSGSVHDPVGREGLTRVVARLIRMGTRTMRAHDVEENIARLGAQLSIDVSASYVRFSGTVIRKNLEPFCALLSNLLSEPAFRAADMAQAVREMQADLITIRDNDRALADKFLRRILFKGHPYARPIQGNSKSLSSITRNDMIAHYQEHYRSANMIVGIAGDVQPEELSKLVRNHFGHFIAGTAPREPLRATQGIEGRHVFVIDKPDRSQTQIMIGTLGCQVGDPMLTPLIVANTVFGGTFTSTLTREVRSKRGWSYGASSRLGHDRQRDAWYMWTFPAAKDAVACVDLELKLLNAWWERGVDKQELEFAKGYLANSYAFDIDTASKRLDQQTDIELFGLPQDYYTTYVDRINETTQKEANQAVRARISKNNLAIVMVATQKEVLAGLRKLKSVDGVHVIPFDAE